MKKEAIIKAIGGMRDREVVQAIARAADARDEHLLAQESYRVSVAVFARFKDLKRGDTVYVHAPRGKVDKKRWWMCGRPLTVWTVHQRDRAIEVRTDETIKVQEPTGRTKRVSVRNPNGELTSKTIDIMRTVERPLTARLKWSVLAKLKVSTEPTPDALSYVLKGGQQ
jgi:hypothetical protein